MQKLHQRLIANSLNCVQCTAKTTRHQATKLPCMFCTSYTCFIAATGQASLPCWSAALSRALCFIHKQQQSTPTAGTEGSKPRILCITGSPDVPAQYIATMNAIFSAQVYARQDTSSCTQKQLCAVKLASMRVCCDFYKDCDCDCDCDCDVTPACRSDNNSFPRKKQRVCASVCPA